MVLVAEIEEQILSVCFEPTNACPGKCPYCLIEEHDDEASVEVLNHTLAHLVSAGVKRVGFGGGEPLLRPEVFTMGELLRQQGVGSLLRTSGMFEIDAEKAKRAFDWVDLSMDSSDPMTFKRCRPGVPLDVLKSNIVNLVENGNRVRVSILVTTRNVHSLEETVGWLAESGVAHLRVQRLVQRGKAVRTWSKLKLAASDEDAAVATVLEASYARGVEARELKSVNSTTLCIVKASGDVYRGTPTGIELMSHVCDSNWFGEKATSIHASQKSIYARVFDADEY